MPGLSLKKEVENKIGSYNLQKEELNDLTNTLIRNSSSKSIEFGRGKDRNVILPTLFIIMLAIVIIIGVILYSHQSETNIYNPLEVNNVTTYMQPEYTSECTKLEYPGTNEYDLHCEKVK